MDDLMQEREAAMKRIDDELRTVGNPCYCMLCSFQAPGHEHDCPIAIVWAELQTRTPSPVQQEAVLWAPNEVVADASKPLGERPLLLTRVNLTTYGAKGYAPLYLSAPQGKQEAGQCSLCLGTGEQWATGFDCTKCKGSGVCAPKEGEA